MIYVSKTEDSYIKIYVDNLCFWLSKNVKR